jgi:uncharacterized protein (DUF2461 family)
MPLVFTIRSRWFEVWKPVEESVMPKPDLDAEDVSRNEWCEAFPTWKGMMQRREGCNRKTAGLALRRRLP